MNESFKFRTETFHFISFETSVVIYRSDILNNGINTVSFTKKKDRRFYQNFSLIHNKKEKVRFISMGF